jgi:4-hydroxybenzoate polyprenyltransferase
MHKLKYFLQIIRWPNLVFIVITQIAFYYLVMLPVYQYEYQYLRLTPFLLSLLIAASVCIAAAGNIINDYFDVNIDLINKPDKVIVGKVFSRRTAIVWHLSLSFIGVALSFYISYHMKQRLWWLGFTNLMVVLVLVLYSTSLKKKLLIGNIVISLLTAWVIVTILFSQFQLNYQVLWYDGKVMTEKYSKLFRIGILYAGFAFLITLMREIVKDMEDFIGDQRNQCKTVPIVWGFTTGKIIVAITTVFLIVLLLILQLYVLQFQWYLAIVYALVLIIGPLVFSMKVLQASVGSLHYHTLSNLYKAIMFTGILSMIFFKIYE